MFGLFERKGAKLSMEEALEAMKENPSIRLIDVRTPEEYRQGHIPGSVSVPLDHWQAIVGVVPDKSTPLFVYCLSGARSQAACKGFTEIGYQQVTNIGGINAYRGPVER